MKTRIFTTVMMVFFTVSLFCGTTFAKGKEFKIVSNLEMAVDPMIKIENWMVNNMIWKRASEFNLAAERDEMLMIEPWMTNQGLWEKSEVVDEKELAIEGWMVDENVWDASSLELKIEKDRALNLETWMTDNTNWK